MSVHNTDPSHLRTAVEAVHEDVTATDLKDIHLF